MRSEVLLKKDDYSEETEVVDGFASDEFVNQEVNVESEEDLTRDVAREKYLSGSRDYNGNLDLVKQYLHEIGIIPMLEPEEEKAVIKRLNEGTAEEKEEAKNILISSNLRLVISVAKKSKGTLPFLDLVQEGTIGLQKAVDSFDYTKGARFSTYAYWWIRQAISRACANDLRTIRIPVHITEKISLLRKVERELFQELGRTPTEAEIGKVMGGLSADKVRDIRRYALNPVSLETPMKEDDSLYLYDVIEDRNMISPKEIADKKFLHEALEKEFHVLSDKEMRILTLRYGLDGEEPRTLDEIHAEFGVTREGVRQIEIKALKKLQRSCKKKKLRDFIM